MNREKNIFFKIYICIAIAFMILSSVFVINVLNLENPQDEYGKFLVEQNNNFAKLMYDFLITSEEVGDEFSEESIPLLEKMSNQIIEQNNIVKNLERNPPDETNADYYNLIEQIRQTYLFLLQGEINILEQLYLSKEEQSEGVFKTGIALQNVMGEIILQFPKLINDVRGTDFKSNYVYIPDDDSLIIEDILTDKEYNEYLNTSESEE